MHFLVDSRVLKLEKNTLAPRAFSLSIFSGIESTLWQRKGIPIKRAPKTIMLHSRDVENCENTAATLVGKGGIEKKGRTYCVTGEPNDVSYKNNTDIPDISVHYFPKDVALCPKWTRFDRRHRGDFTLQCRRLYAFYRLRRRLLRTHITSQIRGTQPMNLAEKNAD